jgi:hypothetical protein
MANKGILEKAMKQPELLVKVAEFKRKFYPRNWAKYEYARIGTLRLLPPPHSFSRLKEDYRKMRAMIYGECPDFEKLIAAIANIEDRINTVV